MRLITARYLVSITKSSMKPYIIRTKYMQEKEFSNKSYQPQEKESNPTTVFIDPVILSSYH